MITPKEQERIEGDQSSYRHEIEHTTARRATNQAMCDYMDEGFRLALQIARTKPTTLAGCAAVLKWASTIARTEDVIWPDCPDILAENGVDNPHAVLAHTVAAAIEQLAA